MLLKSNIDLMSLILPQDGSAEDIDVDENLSFLDDYVSEMGGSDYKKETERSEFFEKKSKF
jgi:hypothetical protein